MQMFLFGPMLSVLLAFYMRSMNFSHQIHSKIFTCHSIRRSVKSETNPIHLTIKNKLSSGCDQQPHIQNTFTVLTAQCSAHSLLFTAGSCASHNKQLYDNKQRANTIIRILTFCPNIKKSRRCNEL